MDGFHPLTQAVRQALAGDDLFDAIPDTVYFLKDRQGRYTAVNQTLVERTGRTQKNQLIGLTADRIFPAPLGRRIAEQDMAIMQSGRSLKGELELHLYADGSEGWCLTWKAPVRDHSGAIVGLLGLSRDVRPATDTPAQTEALSATLTYARHHIELPLRLGDLAARAQMSVFQFDQRLRLLFGMSAGQYVTRLRIEHACDRLRHTDTPISEIALDCGYSDQTAFARQFRKVVGLPPLKYRTRSAPVPA